MTSVQATVASFDPTTRGGSVLTDEGIRLAFDAAALTGTRLRLLRPGQRVRITRGSDGAVTALQILTLG